MLTNPVGIGTAIPRFSWQLQSEERGVMQTNYQMMVASSLEKLSKNEGDLWNSGKVHSDKSILLSYAGKPLNSRQTCFWKVKVWTNIGETDWSTPSSFTIGLLNASDWMSKWIGLDKSFPWDSVSKFARLSARYFRKEFKYSQKIKRATVYVAGLGLYELYINGERIGQQVLSPSPTDYSKTILYNTFDVTSNIRQGTNVIGTVLGNGRFFTMRQHYKPQKWHNFGFPQMICQLEIEYADGKKQIVISDASWRGIRCYERTHGME
jgi:alpha-L-rhamnosidase